MRVFNGGPHFLYPLNILKFKGIKKMAESKVSISNQALVKCGANTISSFTDGSHEANTCSTMYDNARDGLLYYTFWNFAVTKQALSLTTETPVDKSYTKVHTLPGDIIRVKGMIDSSGFAITDYSIENSKVYSNTDPLNIEYVQRLDESKFPVFFTEALIAKLAAEINESITGVGSLTARLTQEFQLKLRASRIADGQENPSVNIVPAGRLVEAHIGTNSSLNGRLRHPTS